MKDQNSPNTPTAEMLADAWRKHYAFGTWHWHDDSGYGSPQTATDIPDAVHRSRHQHPTR